MIDKGKRTRGNVRETIDRGTEESERETKMDTKVQRKRRKR